MANSTTVLVMVPVSGVQMNAAAVVTSDVANFDVDGAAVAAAAISASTAPQPLARTPTDDGGTSLRVSRASSGGTPASTRAIAQPRRDILPSRADRHHPAFHVAAHAHFIWAGNVKAHRAVNSRRFFQPDVFEAVALRPESARRFLYFVLGSQFIADESGDVFHVGHISKSLPYEYLDFATEHSRLMRGSQELSCHACTGCVVHGHIVPAGTCYDCTPTTVATNIVNSQGSQPVEVSPGPEAAAGRL